MTKYGNSIELFIDEFADLMTTNRREVAPLIQRLAQIGRAAKVHIILCTQTPIAKVIPTEIKCNFDSRIGLRTRSRQDSVNILGYKGLENLPEYGEGVYMTPKGDHHISVPYIDETEQNRLIEFWEMQKTYSAPTYTKQTEKRTETNKQYECLFERIYNHFK